MIAQPVASQTIPALIADLLRGGRELRPAQIEMAVQVAHAIEEQIPVILEASTGTGKTGGYLVPIIRSGKVAIISTGNKALQDQIFLQDIPFLQQHLQQSFTAVRMKGVANYVCKDRLHEARKDLRVLEQHPELGRLVDLVNSDYGFAGDFESLDFALPADIRNRVNGDGDVCAWSRCDFFGSCFIRQMRDRAATAQIIIVNHTLLLLDALTEGALLPDHDLLVLDEAHHIAEEATSVFTVSVRPTQLTSLLQLRVVKQFAPEKLYKEIEQVAGHLWYRIEQTVFGNATKVPFREPMLEALTLAAKLTDLAAALRKARPANQSEKDDALYDKLLTRVGNLANALQLVFAVQTAGDYVHYVERVVDAGQRAPRFQVCAAPLNVAPFLKEKVFDKTQCIVMTSATLATGAANPTRPDAQGPFAYFRKQVGLSPTDFPQVIERVLPLTFDYKSHALLYVPRGVPEPVYGTGPHVERYLQAVAEEMRRLVLASRGRAFLLFSSRRMLDEVYRRIAPSLPFPVLSQGGEMSRAELTRRFRTEQGAVLFGLKSFWEGVDIAGDALSLVVIDKLPFGPPDDPVHAERVNQMKAKGENWFGEYVLPQVVLQLKQGVGRLLRTSEDRGVMAILDTRLLTKGYGRQVLGALPPATRATTIAEVEQFFALPSALRSGV